MLATRAGIRPPEATRDYLAWMTSQLEDAVPAGPGARSATPRPRCSSASTLRAPGRSMRRPLDYYEEGAAPLARSRREAARAHGRSALARRLLPQLLRRRERPAGAPRLRPRRGARDCSARSRPFDWRGFFAERVERVPRTRHRSGLAAAGWSLAYSAEPNLFMVAREKSRKSIDWSASLGLVIERRRRDARRSSRIRRLSPRASLRAERSSRSTTHPGQPRPSSARSPPRPRRRSRSPCSSKDRGGSHPSPSHRLAASSFHTSRRSPASRIGSASSSRRATRRASASFSPLSAARQRGRRRLHGGAGDYREPIGARRSSSANQSKTTRSVRVAGVPEPRRTTTKPLPSGSTS